MQPSTTSGTTKNVSDLLTDERRSSMSLFALILVTALGLTLAGATIGFIYALGGLVVLVITALIIRRPVVGLYAIAVCALAVDAEPIVVKGVTINLYVFYWPPGLTALIDRPIGLLMLFVLLLCICRNLIERQRALHGGELLLPFLFFSLCLAYGVVHGLATHGDFKTIVLELRPFEYLFLSYLLAYNLIGHKDHIRHFFWLVIVCAGVRTLYGLFLVLVILHGHLTATQNEIMPHEESFFFVALLLLVMLFSLRYRYRPQFYAALCLLPLVLVVLVANQRRADYVAFLVGAAVAWILVIVVKPQARKKLIAIAVVCAILGVGYIAIFSHASGAFAEPARGIVSVFHPDASDIRDHNSNLYRTNEDFDLKYTVMQSPLIGYGFGKPFLTPIPLPLANPSPGNPDSSGNIFVIVPHNTIYWVWMRLGAIGFFAFWFLIGAVIVRGCLIMRRLKDPYLQLVSIYIIGVTFMEILVASADYQLYFYRNVIYVGLLFGILMKLPALDTKEVNPVNEATHGNAELSLADVGRRHA